MFRHECKHAFGVGAAAIAVVVIGWGLVHPGPALSQPVKEKAAKANEDSLAGALRTAWRLRIEKNARTGGAGKKTKRRVPAGGGVARS